MPGKVIISISGRLRDERGVALVVALVALLVGLLLATTVVMAATGEGFLSNHDTASKRAFEAAQAGLQQTVYDMNTLLNTAQGSESSYLDQCVAGANFNGTYEEKLTNPTINPDSGSATGYVDCGPYQQSLGNGAFFISWTSIVLTADLTAQDQKCAGVIVGVSEVVTNRCVASEGIVCPPSYSTPTCANPVTSRVEERVAASTGKPLFPVQGVLAPNGTLVRNTGKIYGNLSTNEEVGMTNSAQVTRSIIESSQPADPFYPLISQSAKLCNNLNANPVTQEDCTSADAGTVCNASTSTWPSACVARYTDPTTGGPGQFSLLDNPPPYAWATDDGRITCAINNACPHDTFSTSSGPCLVNSTGCATWDATYRVLSIPNGVTWLIGQGSGTFNYNLCSFTMSGGNAGTQTKLAVGVRAEIYIDSPKNPSPSPTPCDPTHGGNGTITVGQGASFVNQSSPLPNSPLPVDTTALFIDVFGQISPIPDQSTDPQNPPASYNYNSCNLNGNTTDSSCVQLGQSSNFYGTVWAPESDVKIANTGATYGGIAGRTVTFDNPGSFTQDVNVTKLITTATQALYFRTAWIQCYSSPTDPNNPLSGC